MAVTAKGVWRAIGIASNSAMVLIGVGMIALVVAGIVSLFDGCSGELTDSQRRAMAESERLAGVELAAEGFVRDHLRSPGTADFGWAPDHQVSDRGEGVYDVSGQVEASNALGTPIQQRFHVRLRQVGDQYRLITLELGGEMLVDRR